LTVNESELVPPTLVAEQLEVEAAVSDVKFWTPQPELITNALSGSVTVQVTVTLDVYQPFAPAVPETTLLITGGVESVMVE
jgi:hypothetical protein